MCGLQIANFTAFISPKPQDSALSLLPPWHIYERAVGYYLYARACRQVRPAGWAELQCSTSAACVTFTCCHCSCLHAEAGEASAALPDAPSVLVPLTGSSTPAHSAAHPPMHACWVMGCKCSSLACLLTARTLLALRLACSKLIQVGRQLTGQCCHLQVYSSVRHFRDDLQKHPPTYFVCVPLVLDSLRTRVSPAAAHGMTCVRQKAAGTWAVCLSAISSVRMQIA